MAIPTVLYFLIVDLWSMGVALFYLASYQCTELGYFETARQTSGIGLSQMPPRIDGGGPDLSGF